MPDELADAELLGDELVDALPRDPRVPRASVPLSRPSASAWQPALRHHPELLRQADVHHPEVIVLAGGEGVDPPAPSGCRRR